MNNETTKAGRFASKKRRRILGDIGIYAILVVMSLIWLIPFIYLILQSFAVQFSASNFIPREFTGDNYGRLFDFSSSNPYPFWQWWLNTFLISLITSILQTILILASSYALSRLRFKMRKPLMKLILVLGMFPGFLGMVIIYFLLKLIGLEANIFSLILIYIGGSIMSYYISKGFFDTIPKSLDEAAMIDGANKFTIFFKIVLPLSKPIVVYTLLLAFVGPWGDYMMAAYLAQGNSSMFNVAVGLQQMLEKGAIATYFPTFCAGGVITSIPIMGLFFWLQKYYVEGVTGGAVKG